MSRSKPRAKRPHDSIHRSQGFRSDLDLSDDCTPLQSSITSASEFLLSDIKSARSNPKLETMSDTSHAKESCLRNGFHPKSLKSDNENDVCTPSSDGNAADMYLKTSTNGTAFNVFEHTKRIMDDKESNTLSDVKDRNLPKYEESFIEGFSVMAFSSAADMNLYERLMEVSRTRDAAENEESGPPASRRSGVRSSLSSSAAVASGGLGRQRRGVPRASTGRGRRGGLNNATASTVANTTTANGSGCLGPLHIDISPTSSLSTVPGNEAASNTNTGIDPAETDKENGTCRLPNGETEKQFPHSSPTKNGRVSSGSSSSTSTNTATGSGVSTVASSIAQKRNMFSIAALTDTEDTAPANHQNQSSGHIKEPQSVNAPASANHNGIIAKTGSTESNKSNSSGDIAYRSREQWLELLSKSTSSSTFSEEELRHLAHLLITDRVFKDRVVRLGPSVPRQVVEYCQCVEQQHMRQLHVQQHMHFQQQMHHLQFQQSMQAAASSVGGTASLSVQAPGQQNGAMLPPPPPVPLFAHPGINSGAAGNPRFPAYGGQQPQQLAAAVAAAAAAAAAMAKGMTPNLSQPNHFQGQCPHPPLSVPSSTSSSLTSGSTCVPWTNHNASSNGHFPAPPMSHMHDSFPRFPYFMVPPNLANSTSASKKFAPVVDAVDLTSGGNSSKEPPSSSTVAQKRSPILRHPNQLPQLPLTQQLPQQLQHPMAKNLASLPPEYWVQQRVASIVPGRLTMPAPPPASLPSHMQNPSQRHQQLLMVQQLMHQQHTLPPQLRPPLPSAVVRRTGRFQDQLRIEAVPSNYGGNAHLRICYHIMVGLVRGQKPVHPANPWWYRGPSERGLVKPLPRVRLPQPLALTSHPQMLMNPSHPHPHPTRFPPPPSYEHFMRSTAAAMLGGGGGPTTPSAAAATASAPIAIDLTRSTPPPGSRKPTSTVSLSASGQDADLSMALKRRRVGETPQFIGSSGLMLPQNGGPPRMPMGFPHPQQLQQQPSNFRHPI